MNHPVGTGLPNPTGTAHTDQLRIIRMLIPERASSQWAAQSPQGTDSLSGLKQPAQDPRGTPMGAQGGTEIPAWDGHGGHPKARIST